MDKTQEEVGDMTLIQMYLTGDEQAFALLYAKHKDLLYRYLERLLAYDRFKADDIFQQTWIRALDHLAEYRDQQLFKAWLLRIAHNLVVDNYRKDLKILQRESVSLDDEENHFEPMGKHSEPWRNIHSSELGEAIHKAVDTLDPELKEVFLLRQEEVPFKEIARIQNSSINTVLGRMQYALKNLRKQLAEWKS